MASRTRYLTSLFLLPLAALSGGPAAGEWVPLEPQYQAPGLYTVYVDPDSLSRQGDLVTLWHLTDYTMMQGNVGFGGLGSHRFFSTKTRKRFDCARKRVRLLAYEEYYGHMATGRRNDGIVDQDTWLSVEPDSLNDGLWVRACAQPAQPAS